jgi:hypothetical protein
MLIDNSLIIYSFTLNSHIFLRIFLYYSVGRQRGHSQRTSYSLLTKGLKCLGTIFLWAKLKSAFDDRELFRVQSVY